MNERFRELHNQARNFYLQDEYLDVSTKELHRLVEQKFAEFLIKEMLEVQRQLKIAGVEHGSDMDQALLVYFGVEE